MKIAVASDHRGYHLKSRIVKALRELGHEVFDDGTHAADSVDYPDYAAQVARRVSTGEAARGILVCGTGIGMAITANKFRGVRATTCGDEATAEVCRRHNDVNVLCLSGDAWADRPFEPMLGVWLNTPFDGGRHASRLTKIHDIERSSC
ncbi:MAG: ribose 5-phosphate isomerase B [Planctomycetota bacterium]|nr:ribose 5-phosphate isomerase B [Planctomycetota bacterium]MDA1177313.1 ribose 5-phosphate isomerase B [Planctomycetota bacterium]